MSAESETYSLLESSPNDVLARVDEAVCALDDEWRFTFVNSLAASLLDRTPEQLLGEDLRETVPGIDDGIVGQKLREAMETQDAVRFDHYNDSIERWFQVRLYPSEDGVTACFYDITDERGKRLDLQRKRRLFETVFAETEDALVVADIDRRITEFNSAAEQLFGYDASEVVGEEARLLYADTAEHEQERQTHFTEDVPERGETYVAEYERADGTTFEGETFGTSLNGPGGKTLALLGSIRDVSAQIEYEQEIKARNDALRTFHEIVTDEGRGFDEQIEALLELGTDHLGLEAGILSRIRDDECTVEHITAPGGTIGVGDRFDCRGTFCDPTANRSELVTITDTGESGHEHLGNPELDIGSYVAVPVVVDGEQYGTLAFWDSAPRQGPFAEDKGTFVRVLAQWIGKELSRERSRERATANRKRLR
jgi:PAS domain S-box-containing protein